MQVGGEDADVGQIAVEAVRVHAIANHEAVGDGEANVVDGDVEQAHRLTVEQHAETQTAGAAGAQHAQHVANAQAGVHDVLDQQHIAASNRHIQILDDAHTAPLWAVAGDGHEVEVDRDSRRDGTHQVGKEEDGAGKQTNHQQR